MSRATSLQTLLEQLKNAQRINLSDMYIQDEGAKLLCSYIRSNPHLRCLELRGNQLTSQGLQEIMDTLANSSIRLLTLDWNRVGAPTRRGVDALAHFLQNNHTLQHLSLQNNELGAEEIHSLLQALERNTGLLSLDLKWNPLGGRVGPLLAQALGANRALLYLELGGCDIATNDLDRIDQILATHRHSNPITKQRILEHQEEQNQPSEPHHLPQEQVLPSSQMIVHLEQVLEQERLHSLQIKQRMERELDELSRRDKQDNRLLEELESRTREYEGDNRAAQYALEKLRDECMQVERQQDEQVRVLEDKVRQNEMVLSELEKKHRSALDRVLNENNYRIRDVCRDWESRCRTVEERARLLENENQILEDELRQLGERQSLLRVQYDQELRDLGRRVEEEEYQKFNVVAQNLDSKIKTSEEALHVLHRRNQDMLTEYKRRDQIGKEELSQLHEDLQNLRQDNRTFQDQNTRYKVECERLKQEISLKQTAILKYEQEINTINEQIELKRRMHRDQLESLVRSQSQDQQIWEQEREKQHARVVELERLLQQTHSDNTRLRQEFQRLSEVIQFNVHKVLQQTFIDNKYF